MEHRNAACARLTPRCLSSSWRPASESTTSAPRTHPAHRCGWTRSRAASLTPEPLEPRGCGGRRRRSESRGAQNVFCFFFCLFLKKCNNKVVLKRTRERKRYLAHTTVLRVWGTTDRQTKCLIVERENAPLPLSARHPAVAPLRSSRTRWFLPSASGLDMNWCFTGLRDPGNDVLLKLREDQSNITGHLNCGFNFSLSKDIKKKKTYK